MEQYKLEHLTQQAYDEAHELCLRPGMGEVVNRMTVLYGPPRARPDLALISFQGGAEDPTPSLTTWPRRLRYLDSPYKFGRNLRRYFDQAGLERVLEANTVAMAAVFPEAPACDARKWMARTGPRARWRRFSSQWVRRLLLAMQPRAILVFGHRASVSLGIDDEWVDEVYANHRGRVFARGHFFGSPAVYCHH
ncbi:MAG: hypothetical protein F4213_18635 [Boseongicola sp. SB0677_bin_26]|nr:hypothetical protein [Boseongicola sp. SB0677_bin_26]